MFSAIDQWHKTGQSTKEFLKGKPFNEHKFYYWLAKWKKSKGFNKEVFKPLGMFSETKLEKIIEIVTASGTKITIFR
jgi:hypothetical protein